MAHKIVIDPVTRIEGHLKVEVDVENGVAKDARLIGTMFRGLEQLVEGKDPRDVPYVVERACGVCAGVHGWASCEAVEEAHGAKVPEMGRVLRNLMMGALWLHDSILHFYHLAALDYIDPTAVLSYSGSVPELVAVKEKIKALAEAGDLHPVLPAYKPDDFCIRDPELVTELVYHYLQALEIQAKGRKASAIFAGKQPHHSTVVVGGVTFYPNLSQVQQFRRIINEVIDFTKNTYIPDALLLATGPLKPLELASIGATAGHYLSFGGYPLDQSGEKLLFPSGVIFDNKFNDVKAFNPEDIREVVDYSWYKDEARPGSPAERITAVDLDKAKGYSFVKAPRYQDKPMEVGPLARMLIMKPAPFVELMEALDVTRPGAVMRHAAKAVDTLVMADAIPGWIDELVELIGASGVYGSSGNAAIHDTDHWDPPFEGAGKGLQEAPRGALGHYITISNKKVKRYQMVVPTTWNASPRDDEGQRGPMEEAIIGAPVPDPENPLNVVRIIRSFNPCLACAIHITSPKGSRVVSLNPGY
ncbi:MAG: nickel-dependent hydrogenase large subunit [Bacillota bacterium]